VPEILGYRSNQVGKTGPVAPLGRAGELRNLQARQKAQGIVVAPVPLEERLVLGLRLVEHQPQVQPPLRIQAIEIELLEGDDEALEPGRHGTRIVIVLGRQQTLVAVHAGGQGLLRVVAKPDRVELLDQGIEQGGLRHRESRNRG